MAAELARTPPHETASGRRKLAAKGQTAYGTSFPVPNKAYLKKALQAVGRAPAGKRGTLARFLRKRARQLGATNVIRGSWADNTQGATAMANAYIAAVQLTTPDVSSSSGPRVTQHADSGGADALKAKIKAKLIARGMPEARAELFASNSVARLRKQRSTVSMANADDGDGDNDSDECATMLADPQKTLSHLARDHHLRVDTVASPIAEHREAHDVGSTDAMVRLHRAVEGKLGHEYGGKSAAQRPRQTQFDQPSPGKD